MSRRSWAMVGMMLLLAAGAVALRLTAGDAKGGLHWPESPAYWSLRGDRAWAGCIVGAALAVGGVLLQSLLRNPLASPDLIGPAAGAALGVMVAMYLAHEAGGGTLSTTALTGPALAGSLAALALVYIVSQRRGLVEPVSLVLVGVMVSTVCGAAALLVSRLLPPTAERIGATWMFGFLSDEARPATLWTGTAVVVAVGAAGAWLGPAMDALAMSEDEARSVGVAVGPLRLGLFLAAGILAAVAVVVAGPIGFVGLVCPHLFRLLGGPAHRPLVVGAGAAGAALVVGADVLVEFARVQSGRLPIGVLTTLIGGPVFLVLLRRVTPRE